MSTKHTPGPWHVAYQDRNGQSVVKGDHFEIATCWHHCVGSIEKEMHANARLIAAAPDLLEALKLALPFMESEAVIQGYGYYRPKNPHDFHPDHESCTEQEIANHKAACDAFDAGNYRDDYGDGWVTPMMHVTKAPWGIGSYTETIPEIERRCEFARAAIAKATGAPQRLPADDTGGGS